MCKKSGVQPRLIKTADMLHGGSTTEEDPSSYGDCTASVHGVRDRTPLGEVLDIT